METSIQHAYNIFITVVTWMKNTTIINIAGVNVTFLGLLCCIAVINIAIWVLYSILGFYIDGEI